VTIIGSDAHDLLSSCAAAGDINGDGIVDLLLGTSFARGPGNQRIRAGEAYVIFGSPDMGGVLDLGQGHYDIVIFGAEENDRLGGAVGTVDINGDGILEIVTVAVDADGPDNARTDAGEVYIITVPSEGS